jgi:DNA-binding transcriptional MerR regulator
MDAAWTLTELVDEAAAALAKLPAPDNGQIRAVPDERSLRYYTTLGLLDRPAAMRGRTALYSRRHLAQVVAIKRMQQTGKSLAEIQSILATIDDATLARVSGVALPKPARPAPARAAFWKTPAAAAVVDRALAPAPAVAQTPQTPAHPQLRLRIAPGVDLLVAHAMLPPLAALDHAALVAAAQPLLAELARQGRSQG